MARQKCVMSAMLQQLDPVTVLTNFNKIAAAGKEIVATDIPTSRVDTMMDLAMKAKAKPLATLGFVPPTIYPGDPNFDKIHRMVAAKIHRPQRRRTTRRPHRRRAGGRIRGTQSGRASRVEPALSTEAEQPTTTKKTTSASNADEWARSARPESTTFGRGSPNLRRFGRTREARESPRSAGDVTSPPRWQVAKNEAGDLSRSASSSTSGPGSGS